MLVWLEGQSRSALAKYIFARTFDTTIESAQLYNGILRPLFSGQTCAKRCLRINNFLQHWQTQHQRGENSAPPTIYWHFLAPFHGHSGADAQAGLTQQCLRRERAVKANEAISSGLPVGAAAIPASAAAVAALINRHPSSAARAIVLPTIGRPRPRPKLASLSCGIKKYHCLRFVATNPDVVEVIPLSGDANGVWLSCPLPRPTVAGTTDTTVPPTVSPSKGKRSRSVKGSKPSKRGKSSRGAVAADDSDSEWKPPKPSTVRQSARLQQKASQPYTSKLS